MNLEAVMKRITLLWAFALMSTIASTNAYAQATRTFVSGHGSDENPCSLAAPCRSFAGALAQTNAGGEIAVLDTAGYGTVTINKSISIINPGGVEAGISVPSGGTGILITAGSVALRGLTLEGAGVGQDGIKLTGGSRLEIVNCVIRDFTHDGIYINPSSGTTTLSISNTIASDNGDNGIDIGPAAGSATVDGVISETLTNNNASSGIVVYALNGVTLLAIAISGGTSDNNDAGISVYGLIMGGYNTSVIISNLTASNNKSYGMQNNLAYLTLSQDKFLANDFVNSGGQPFDVDNENNGMLFLFNNNIMSALKNSAFATSDGTNNITQVGGTLPQKRNPL
jgi:hypothetical protein